MSGPLASRREDLLPDDIDDPELLLRALARFPRFPRLLCSRKCCGNHGEIGGMPCQGSKIPVRAWPLKHLHSDEDFVFVLSAISRNMKGKSSDEAPSAIFHFAPLSWQSWNVITILLWRLQAAKSTQFWTEAQAIPCRRFQCRDRWRSTDRRQDFLKKQVDSLQATTAPGEVRLGVPMIVSSIYICMYTHYIYTYIYMYTHYIYTYICIYMYIYTYRFHFVE